MANGCEFHEIYVNAHIETIIQTKKTKTIIKNKYLHMYNYK